MSFQRIRRDKSGHFTTINNTVIRDANLSLKAKGLMLTVMGLPDGWDFTVAGLISIVKEGKAAIYAAMRELREAGYVTLTKEYDEGGKVTAWNYTFRECPQKPLTDFQEVGFQEVENQDVENRTQYKKQRINKTKNQETLDTHIEAEPEVSQVGYPFNLLIDSFPNVNFTPAMAGFVEADVLDAPLDREAWNNTIRIYQMNYDPARNRYLPDKIANVLGVFKSEKTKLEKQHNGASVNGHSNNKPEHANTKALREWQQLANQVSGERTA